MLIINKHFNFCCFSALAYTTLDRLCAVFTRHSLVRAKDEVFVLLYVFLFVFFVRSTISRKPAGRFTRKFACGRTLVPDVSSLLLRVSGPGGWKKGEMKFLLL